MNNKLEQCINRVQGEIKTIETKKKGKKAVDEAASDETRTGSTDLPGKLLQPLNSAPAA